MDNNLITVSRGELEVISDHEEKLQKQNMKLVALRKKQVYNALKEATVQRLKTSRQITNWIKMLSEKIFNPETIEEMDLNKAIALFKYVNNINLKVLAESNRLEEVLSKYIESGVMDTASRLQKHNSMSNEREQIKFEILNRLNRMFRESGEDAEIVEFQEEVVLTVEEEKELENAERELEDNLASMDDEIELDITSGLDEY